MKRVVYNSYGVWRVYNSNGQLKVYSPVISDEINLMETDFDFSLCSDKYDNIYIICQNNYGDIYFITLNGEKTEKICMLESKIKEGYEKEFNLIYVNGWINALYMLKHEDKTVIIHHIVNSRSQPEIIETVGLMSPLFACVNGVDLYAFYIKNSFLVYKKYKWGEKKWTESEAICNEDEKVVYINAEVSEKINLVYCTEKKNKYNAVYATNEYKYELIKNSTSIIRPVICENRNIMHVIFEYGGRLLESTEEAEGRIISKPRYSYYGTFEKSEAVEISTPDHVKLYTYGYETKKGEFRPLIIGDIKVGKVTKIEEIRSELEDEKQNEKIQKSTNPYEEILKMLDRKNEMKVLSEISKRLAVIEDVISKLVNITEGNEDNGNKGKME